MKRLMGIAWLCFTATTLMAEHAIFYLDGGPSSVRCSGHVVEIPSRKVKELFRFEQCPAQVIFGTGLTFLFENGQVWEGPRDGKEKPKLLGTLPPSGIPPLLWREKGKLRAITSVEIPEADISAGKVKFEGKAYPMLDPATWGVSHLFIAHEWDGKKWQRTELAAGKAEAGDTQGAGVLKTFKERKPEGFNLETAGEPYGCLGDKLNCDEDQPAYVKKTLGPQEGYGRLEISKSALAVFPVAVGDTPHAMSPLFLCDAGCRKPIPLLREKDRQLGLKAKGDYLLFATEYTHENPTVVDVRTGKWIWGSRSFRNALWMDP